MNGWRFLTPGSQNVMPKNKKHFIHSQLRMRSIRVLQSRQLSFILKGAGTASPVRRIHRPGPDQLLHDLAIVHRYHKTSSIELCLFLYWNLALGEITKFPVPITCRALEMDQYWWEAGLF